MDESKVKSNLKEARDAIKAKDFKAAIKLCKLVLAFDKNNYTGLVLFGAALQESGQKDHAEKAFLKAINVGPKQILAYQGLVSLYEKKESRTVNQDKQLIEAYHKILLVESDLGKCNEICTKLATLANTPQNTNLCLNTLRELCSVEELVSNVARKVLIENLMQLKHLASEYDCMLENVLAEAIQKHNITSEDVLEYYKKYLKILYKQKKNETLYEKAKQMHVLFPSDPDPLEWLCKLFSDDALGGVNECNISDSEVVEWCDKLIVINKTSSVAKLAKGAQLFKKNCYHEASELLLQVDESLATLSLISQCYLLKHSFESAEFYSAKALEIAVNEKPQNTSLIKQLQIVLAKSLSFQNTETSLKNTITTCQELLNIYPNNPDLQVCLARGFINQDTNIDHVEQILQEVEKNSQYLPMTKLLRGLILKKSLHLKEAATMINAGLAEDPNCIELWLALGEIYRDDGLHDLALQAFLKAAKVSPYCSTCFTFLGHEYSREGNDLEKARRCYLKSYQLNPTSTDAGVGLSDCYRLLKNEESYLKLLKSATSSVGCSQARWAWIRLGVYELEQTNFEEAISCFRVAIRSNPNDSHCWECLGDAYAARGSYSSSLKSYQRAQELQPNALYSMFQVANIKQILGLFEESAEQFKSILVMNPTYISALKGRGETLLHLARESVEKQLMGCAKDYCQLSFDALMSAVQKQKKWSCVWKLLGDVCTLAAELPEKYSLLHVPSWLIDGSEGVCNNILTTNRLLELGGRCFCRALAIAPENSFLWHDLAVNYHLQANTAQDMRLKIQHRGWALSAAKKSVTLNAMKWEHWNILGIISASHELKLYQLAQHSFIMAIQADNNSAVSWTNLATLYLSLNSIVLANKAYRMAQKTDPSYMQSWIGQATLAEATNHEDAMDLFRHTTELGIHPESCIGYAHWVCSTLQHSEAKKHNLDYIYSIENMHAIPRAADAITWYTGVITNDPCAYNMLGLLMERMQLFASATKAFETALDLLKQDKNTESKQDLVLCNYARVLVQLQRFNEAIQQYQLVKEANFSTQCGLALAYFKAEMYEESHSAYETALHWLAPTDGFKSHILVAMAGMAYMFQGIDDAKTLLYQCITLKPTSVQGLFAACSLGMLHSDLKLAELVLSELGVYTDDPDYITDIAIFKAYTFFIKVPICAILSLSILLGVGRSVSHYLVIVSQDKKVEAVRALASSVHRHPGEPTLWLALALLQLQDQASCDPKAAGRCAQVAMTLGRTDMDVSKVMSLVSLSDLLCGKAGSSLRNSQKAVHMFPNIPENWMALIASYLPECFSKRSETKALWLKRIIDHVRRKLDASRKAGKWLSSYERKVTQLAEEYHTN